MRKRLVIVGAGMATSRLLTELARYPHDYAIEVVGEEAQACYNRILLSSLLARDKTLAQTRLIAPRWYRDNRVGLHTSERVIRICPDMRTIFTNRDRRIDYDALVLATGASPFIPPIPGARLANVLGFRNLTDLDRINALASRGRHAVIIGGGLLGLEAAHGLRQLGLSTTIINRDDRLMSRQLGRQAAAVLKDRLENEGMKFRLGVAPEAIEGHAGQATTVLLPGQERIDCDLVLITAGIRPNAELARTAGLNCDRGILIDRRLTTSDAAIHALGECAQLGTELFGLVTPVYEQAAILAANLCHSQDREFTPRPTATQLKVSGIDVVSAGSLDQPVPPGVQEQIVCDTRRGIFRRLLIQDSTLVGFELIGDKRHSASFSALFRAGDSTLSASDIMFLSAGAHDGNNTAKVN